MDQNLYMIDPSWLGIRIELTFDIPHPPQVIQALGENTSRVAAAGDVFTLGQRNSLQYTLPIHSSVLPSITSQVGTNI